MTNIENKNFESTKIESDLNDTIEKNDNWLSQEDNNTYKEISSLYWNKAQNNVEDVFKEITDNMIQKNLPTLTEDEKNNLTKLKEDAFKWWFQNMSWLLSAYREIKEILWTKTAEDNKSRANLEQAQSEQAKTEKEKLSSFDEFKKLLKETVIKRNKDEVERRKVEYNNDLNNATVALSDIGLPINQPEKKSNEKSPDAKS